MAAKALKPGEDGRHITFCRLCEAFCGMVATVKDGRITAIAPDRDNPHSQGHICVKGVAMADLVHDPERVTRPLKRTGAAGEFEPVSWDEALDDIARRLKAIRADHGPGAIAAYLGNPTAFSTNAFSAFAEFMTAIGGDKLYGAGSQDSNARLTANYIIHGAPVPLAIPDLEHCDFLLVIGANPLVSNGWMMFAPRLRHDLDAIAARGRVVVVDPRLSETARRYEHQPIRPNSDVWLLLGLMRAMLDENLIDGAGVEADAVGWETLEAHVRQVDLAEAAERTGISAETLAGLARAFARSQRAAVYGGLGLCRGEFATLGGFLASALNAVTGRYGRIGGMRFGRQVMGGACKAMVGGYGDKRTRIGGVPAIAGKLAGAMLPADIEEDGEGRVRALVVSAGNPILSAPGGERLSRALDKLELMVSLDLYLNETNRHAHYILPATTFLERPDWPMIGMHVLLRPFLQYTDAVIPPVGEAREDYAIYAAIARRMGLGAPSASRKKQRLGRLGLLPEPVVQIDRALRSGPVGDCFGLRPGGWSRAKLRRHPHGVMLDDLPDDRAGWRDRVAYPDGKLRLWHPLVDTEFRRLFAGRAQAAPPLILIGRRDIRSINSWMHNVDRLIRSQEPVLLVHPEDAAARGIADGDWVSLSNDNGQVRVRAGLSDEVLRGVVSYPHGWGHDAGWARANATDAANINLLLGLGVESVEFVSGMTLMDCFGVTLEPVSEMEPPTSAARAEAVQLASG